MCYGCGYFRYGVCTCEEFTEDELENSDYYDESNCPYFSDNSWEQYLDWIRSEDAKIRFFEKG